MSDPLPRNAKRWLIALLAIWGVLMAILIYAVLTGTGMLVVVGPVVGIPLAVAVFRTTAWTRSGR